MNPELEQQLRQLVQDYRALAIAEPRLADGYHDAAEMTQDLIERNPPMTTNDEIRRAYEVLEAAELTPQQLEALRAVMPEEPKQRVSDIDYNESEHFLAQVKDEYGYQSVLLSVDSGSAQTVSPKGFFESYWGDQMEKLVLTGRRYKLVLEDEQPSPQYVETKEEIDALPSGSIICEDGDDLDFVYLRGPLGWVDSNYEDPRKFMDKVKFRVLRVGWGDEL